MGKSLSKDNLIKMNTIRQPKADPATVSSFAQKVGTEFSAQTREISVNAIVRSPYQPRVKLDEDHIEELAESIKHGRLIEAIVVREITDGVYELISGEHRWTAVCRLGRDTILATIRQMSDREAKIATLITNIKQRRAADYEMGKRFKELMADDETMQITDLSKIFGVSRQTVYRCLAVANLSGPIIELLEQNAFFLGGNAADALRSAIDSGNEKEAVEAARLVFEGKLQQSDIAEWIHAQTHAGQKKKDKKPTVPMFRCGDARVAGSIVAKGRKISANLMCDKSLSKDDIVRVQAAVENFLKTLSI